MAIELNNLKNTDVEELKIEDLINIPLIKGEPNTLQIGTVENGENASATITGKAPNQILNLVLPYGKTNSLSVGTVEEGIQANVEIVGEAPNQIINFVIPTYNDTEVKTDITNLKTTKADKTELLSLGLTLGNKISISIDPTTYIMTLELLNSANTVLSTATIDLPLETMVVNARYENTTKELIIVLNNGTELKVPIGDIVNGLVNETTFNSKAEELQNNINTLSKDINAKIAKINEEQATQNEKISNIELEQTTQNNAIQKNANDIITTNETIEEKYNKVKSNLINLTAEGEEIQVNDSSDLEAKIDVRGNTKQETTQGYNLLNAEKMATGKIHINNNIITLDEEYNGSTYILTLCPELKLNDKIIFQCQTTGAPYFYNGKTQRTYSFGSLITVTQDFLDGSTQWYGNRETHTGAIITDLMVVKEENKDKPWEPYTGGQASPNPDYPQEIENVTGDVEVNQTGKNLFDISKINDNSTIIVDNNKLILKSHYCNTLKKFRELLPDLKVGDKFIFVWQKTTGEVKFWADTMYYSTKVYTVTEKLLDSIVIFYGENEQTNFIYNIMFNLGNEIAPYEPYQGKDYSLTLGNIELNKLGDKQDYFRIDKETGKWYSVKEIEKYVFTGNEEILKSEPLNSTNYNAFYILLKENVEKNPNTINAISNNFTGTTANERRKDIANCWINPNINQFYFKLSNTIITIEEAKQFIKAKYDEGNPVIVYYQLKTPAETLIEEPTLISQLNALENAKMFKPTTILTNNSIANMKLDYIADTKTYIDNIIATTNKAIVASEGGN